MIRKSGFLLIVIVPAVALVTLFLMRNVLVTRIAEFSLEKMLGSPVSLQGVSLQPFAMSASFARLEVVDSADPRRYLLVAGPGRFEVNGLQLFATKLIIEELRVEQVATGVLRPESERPPPPPSKPPPAPSPPADGSSGTGSGGEQQSDESDASATDSEKQPPPPGRDAPNSEAEDEESAFSFDLDVSLPTLNLDALTSELDVGRLTGGKGLASMQAIDKAESDARTRISGLQTRLKNADFPGRFTALQRDSKAVNLKPRNLKALQRTLRTLESLNKRARKLSKDLRNETQRGRRDLRDIRANIGAAGGEIAADVAAIRGLAGLANLELSRAGELLFGQVVMEQFNQIMGYLKLAQGMLTSDDGDAAQKPPLRAGRTIIFPVTARAYPSFLVENLAFTGFVPNAQGESIRTFTGTLQGLSSSASTYGKPVLLELISEQSKGERWSIEGKFDHTGDVGSDVVKLTGTRIDMGELDLGEGSGGYLPHSMKIPNAKITLLFGHTGDALNGKLRIDARRVRFAFARPDADSNASIAGSLRDLFAGFQKINLEASLSGTFSDPDFSLSSSIDKVFSRHLNALFSKRMAAIDRQIRADIDRRVQARRAEALAAIEAPIKDLEGSMRQAEAQLKAVQEQIRSQKRRAEKRLKKLF